MVEGTADPVDDPPDEVRPLLDELLEKPSTTRDGMLTRENPLTKPVLKWASEQDDLEPVEQAFRYLAAGMADTARDLPPSCARNEASRAVTRSKCCWATELPPSGERLRVLDPTATCDRAHPAELARWRSGAGRSGRLSFVHGSNRGGHGGRRTTARGGT
jgi:hypothetical protein